MNSYKVKESFEITNRGVAVILESDLRLEPRKSYCAIITKPDGSVVETAACKELIYRSNPVPSDSEAWFLPNLSLSEVPVGSLVGVKEAPSHISELPRKYQTIKAIGHWLGMVLLVLGFALTITEKNGLYFIAGFVLYWFINYLFIRGYLESKLPEPLKDCDAK